MADHRRPGRPPLTPGDTPAKVQVYVPSADYDRAHDRAQRLGLTVPELLRRGLRRELSDSSNDDE